MPNIIPIMFVRSLLVYVGLFSLLEVGDSFSTAVAPFALRSCASRMPSLASRDRKIRLSMCQEAEAVSASEQRRKGLSPETEPTVWNMLFEWEYVNRPVRYWSNLIMHAFWAGPATLDERTRWNMKLSLAKPVEGVFSAGVTPSLWRKAMCILWRAEWSGPCMHHVSSIRDYMKYGLAFFSYEELLAEMEMPQRCKWVRWYSSGRTKDLSLLRSVSIPKAVGSYLNF